MSRAMVETEKKILDYGMELYFKEGECLYKRNQEAEYVFYLKDGIVKVIDEQNQAQEIEGCRCFLGLQDMLLEHKHEATVMVADPSIIVVFDKGQINRLMHDHPTVRRYFMLKMCDHLSVLSKSFE
jgi:CRP-like cAMP-binding protein